MVRASPEGLERRLVAEYPHFRNWASPVVSSTLPCLARMGASADQASPSSGASSYSYDVEDNISLRGFSAR